MFPNYQCPECKKYYDEQSASQNRMVCPDCKILVAMVEGASSISTPLSPASPKPEPGALFHRTTGCAVAELIIPSSNTVDIQAVRQFFSSLPTPIALEFLAEPESIRMLIRGPDHAIQFLAGSIPSIWPRAKLRVIPPTENMLPPESQQGQAIWYTFARAEYLPINILRNFAEGDPMNLLLGAFRGMQQGEGAWLQVFLSDSGKPKWLSDIRRRLKMEEQRGAIVEPVSPTGFPTLMPTAATSGSMALRNILYIAILVLSVPGLIGIAMGGWYMALGVIFLIFLAAGGAALVRYITGMSSDWLQADLLQVSQKVAQSPFFSTSIRLSVWASSGHKAAAIMHQVNHALRQFGNDNGNELVPYTKESATVLPTWPGDLNPEYRPSIWMGATELSAIWHPPFIKEGTAPSFMTTSQVEKRTPPRRDVTGLAPIGTSLSDEGIPVQIDLTLRALIGGMMMVGKSRMGKSTLMELILQAALALPPTKRPASLFFDPHGDSAKRIPGSLPAGCVDDLVYYDVMDPEYTIGTNPLDINIPGNSVDRAVQVIINTGRAIWEDYWGPRMFVPLENTLRALAAANMFRGPDNQLGLSCIVPFLVSNREFRKSFLDKELKANNSPQYSEVAQYFYMQYEGLLEHLRQEIIQPVISKGNRFARSPALYMFSSPRNMLSMQSILRDRKILVISTRMLRIGADLGSFYSSFLLNFIASEMGLQEDVPIASRVPLLLLADECQTFQGYDWIQHMSQLTKLGFWNVLGAQNFATLRQTRDEKTNDFAEIILGGVQSLAVFQCNGADAKKLSDEELSGRMGGPDPDTLINLDSHQCWLKTLSPTGHRLHPFDLEVNPPPIEDPAQWERAMALRSKYSIPVEQAKSEAERVLNEFLVMHGGPSMLSTGATGLLPMERPERTPSGTPKAPKSKPDDFDSLALRAMAGEVEKTEETVTEKPSMPSWNQLSSQQGGDLSDQETESLLSELTEAAQGTEEDGEEDTLP